MQSVSNDSFTSILHVDGLRVHLDNIICNSSSKKTYWEICKVDCSTESSEFTMHWYLVKLQKKALA